MLLYGPLVDQYDLEHSGKDDTWLVGWVAMFFKDPKESKLESSVDTTHAKIRRCIPGLAISSNADTLS